MTNIFSNTKALLLTCLMALFAIGSNAQRTLWDFSDGIDENDVTNLAADAPNWTYDSTNNRYSNAAAITSSTLTANNATISFTSELVFKAKAEGIRLDNKKKSLTLNTNGTSVTIKNLTAGYKVTVACKSSSSSTDRSISATNITFADGVTAFAASKSSTSTTSGTVTADGDVTLTCNGGIYVYSIEVVDPNSITPTDPSSTVYNTVPKNTNKNQMVLGLAGGNSYYNTDDVKVAVDNATGSVTVTPKSGSWSDVYTKTVNGISFAKKVETESDGTVDNSDANKVKITEAKGWMEAAYVKWEPFTGATSYNVYVKGGQYSDYTKIDYQLVRNYGTYGRADIVGLRSGENYSVKVVPVGSDKAEISASANEATAIAVKAYDRHGFAFKGGNAPGAYNLDGTLKDNAVVLYITKDNVNTIEYTVTNGNKTPEAQKGLSEILGAFEKGKETRPFAFRFIGCVSGATGLSSEGGMELKGNSADSEMNVTFEGIGDDATSQFGLCINKAKNVEIRNLGIMLFADDGIQLKTGKCAWIHNNDIFYGNVGGDADQAKGDGSLDTKDKGTLNTFSYNHFWDSGKSSLCGMKSETNDCYEDYHHNWFDHSDSRHPRVRTKSVLVWNNYYDGCAKYGVGSTMGSSVFVEANYYRHTKNPMLISQQGHDGGTFSGEVGGIIKSFGNYYAEANSSQYIPTTYQQNNTNFDCYEATSRTETVPSTVTSKVGGNTYNNFDTNSSLMFDYTANDVQDVPSVVTGFYGAGRLNHGDFQWTFDNSTEDTNYSVITALKSALQSYKTSLVGIYDGENSTSGDSGSGDSGSGDSGSGDSGSGDSGSSEVTGTILCSFNASGSPSATQVTATATSLKSDASATVDGQTYSNCLKLNSSCTVTVTVDKEVTMTIYFGNTGAKSVKVDNTALDVSNQQVTTTVAAGTHTITKGSGEGAIALIKLVPTTTE